MQRRAQASTRKRPITRYKPARRKGTPHTFMMVGEFVTLRTEDSQKMAKPANSRLNGTKSQSLVVNRRPWAGCPHQMIFSPLRRRPWNASVGMRRLLQRSRPTHQKRASTRLQTQCMNFPPLQPTTGASDEQGLQSSEMVDQCERRNDRINERE